jgi:hypothetical protein
LLGSVAFSQRTSSLRDRLGRREEVGMTPALSSAAGLGTRPPLPGVFLTLADLPSSFLLSP